MNLFAVDELRDRLDRRLDVLQGGARDLPERQQTLRRAIEWSNDLLNDAERSVLRLFAVVRRCPPRRRGGNVPTSPALDSIDVVGGLGSLVDKSLVRSSRGLDGRPRFSMLRTIRDYATEQLDSAADLAEPVRQAHAEHYTERALELQTGAERRGPRGGPVGDGGRARQPAHRLGPLGAATATSTGSTSCSSRSGASTRQRGDYAAAIELGDDLLGVLEQQPATAGGRATSTPST